MMSKKVQWISLSLLGILVGSFHGYAEDKMSSYSTSSQPQASSATNLKNSDEEIEAPVNIDMKKLSEAFGHFIGKNLQSPGFKFDLESIVKGIRSGSTGEPAPLSEKEYESMMTAVQEKAFKEVSSNNLKSANEFLSKNQNAVGIVEIVPGKLQYTIIQEGTGPAVENGFSPKIHYTGKYQDGTVFGTSEETGGPITIPLDQTIPGFSKGIVGMKEGEKRRLFVHPDLGYGTSGQLAPNELLIFEVEVIKANAEEEKNQKSKDKDSSFSDADNQSKNSEMDDEDDDYDDDEDDEKEYKSTQKNGGTPQGNSSTSTPKSSTW